jgi:hypothetical protein
MNPFSGEYSSNTLNNIEDVAFEQNLPWNVT